MATATEPKAVFLRGDDNVAVAARPIPRGFVLTVGDRTVEVREPIALGHKVAAGRHRRGRAGPEVRPDHRVRLAGRSRPGAWVHVHNVKADLFERDYAFASERPAGPADRAAADVPGLPPARRPGRHAQLRRGHQHGQLLGEHLAVHRRAVPRRRLAKRLPQRRRRLRDHPQGGLRHAVRRARTTRRSSASWPGSPTIPTSPPTCIVGLGLRGQLRAAPGRVAGPGRCSAAARRTAARPSRSGPGC